MSGRSTGCHEATTSRSLTGVRSADRFGVVYVFTFYVSVPLPYAIWIVATAANGLIAQRLDPDD